MEATYLSESRTLPLVYQPNNRSGAAASSTLDALKEWIGANRQQLDVGLREHGALLFRDFQVTQPDEFQEIVECFDADLLNYTVGNSPRTKVTDKIYTSTEYPPSESIPLHNELSYLNEWPHRICFFCLVPPNARGETPIADSRRLLRTIDPVVRDKFEKNGLKYVQNLHGGDQRIGKSWQAAFETEDRSVVEQVCADRKIDFEWKRDGGLRLVHSRQAIAVHPVTRERMWFSQADLWHPLRFPPATRRVLLSMFDKNDLPNYVCYGDGSEIDSSDFERLSEASEAAAVVFPWQVGDVLVLDNMLVAHGRRPFTGLRKILVAMA